MKKYLVVHNPLVLMVGAPLEDVHTEHNNLDVGDKDTLGDHEVEGVAEVLQDHFRDKETKMILN